MRIHVTERARRPGARRGALAGALTLATGSVLLLAATREPPAPRRDLAQLLAELEAHAREQGASVDELLAVARQEEAARRVEAELEASLAALDAPRADRPHGWWWQDADRFDAQLRAALELPALALRLDGWDRRRHAHPYEGSWFIGNLATHQANQALRVMRDGLLRDDLVAVEVGLRDALRVADGLRAYRRASMDARAAQLLTRAQLLRQRALSNRALSRGRAGGP